MTLIIHKMTQQGFSKATNRVRRLANRNKLNVMNLANASKKGQERPVLSLKPTKHYPSGDNCCLPNVAVFSGVKTKQPSSEFGVTAR